MRTWIDLHIVGVGEDLIAQYHLFTALVRISGLCASACQEMLTLISQLARVACALDALRDQRPEGDVAPQGSFSAPPSFHLRRVGAAMQR